MRVDLSGLPAFIEEHELHGRIDQDFGRYTAEHPALELDLVCGHCLGAIIGRYMRSEPEHVEYVYNAPETGNHSQRKILRAAADQGLYAVSMIDYRQGVYDLALRLCEDSPKFREDFGDMAQFRNSVDPRINDDGNCGYIRGLANAVRFAVGLDTDPMYGIDYRDCRVRDAVVNVMARLLEFECGAPPECFSARQWPADISPTRVIKNLLFKYLSNEPQANAYGKELIDGLLKAGDRQLEPA